MSLMISAAPMFKLLMPIAITFGLCAPMAWGQTTDTRVTPERSCPAEQPYCNNEWEVVGANGKRYWMVRWARSTSSDIVTLRFPLRIVHPMQRINCAHFGKDFPQPSCQQPFAISLLLQATYSDLEAIFMKDGDFDQNLSKITIAINSPAAGALKSNIEDIFIYSMDTHIRIGDRKNYPRVQQEGMYGLSKIGTSRDIVGKEALGLTDIYYDGNNIVRSKNIISCTYDNSPIYKRFCNQSFILNEFNSIARLNYDASYLSHWNEINSLVNKAIKAASLGQ